jgi:hypothetical protein
MWWWKDAWYGFQGETNGFLKRWNEKQFAMGWICREGSTISWIDKEMD